MDNALPLLSTGEAEALEKIHMLFSDSAPEHEEESCLIETTPPLLALQREKPLARGPNPINTSPRPLPKLALEPSE
ncbi:hypothetical protein BHE74_00051040 [Ensete ventricosum]|nr:hypothetical protein BHE74_00051040 [Ensete ventricosum]